MQSIKKLEVKCTPSRTKIHLYSYRYFDIAFYNILKIKYTKLLRQNETILLWLEMYTKGELELPYNFDEIEAQIAQQVDVEPTTFIYCITAGCQQRFLSIYKKIGKKRFEEFFLGILARSFVEFQDTPYAFNLNRNPLGGKND